MTVRLGAGRGPALTQAPRAARIGCRSGGEKSSWKKRSLGTTGGLSAPLWGAKGLLHLLLCSHRHGPPWTPHASTAASLGCWREAIPAVCFPGGERYPGHRLPLLRLPRCTRADNPWGSSSFWGWIPIPRVDPHQATPNASIHPGSAPPSPSCRGRPPVGSHLPAPPALTHPRMWGSPQVAGARAVAWPWWRQ